MVKNKNKINIVLGLSMILYFVLSNLTNNTIDFLGVWYISFGAFLILDAVLDKTGILTVLTGVMVLTSFIILLSQKPSISSLDVVIYLLFPVFMIIMGIGVLLGLFPGKILKSDRNQNDK
jgi:hypothetical protein